MRERERVPGPGECVYVMPLGVGLSEALQACHARLMSSSPTLKSPNPDLFSTRTSVATAVWCGLAWGGPPKKESRHALAAWSIKAWWWDGGGGDGGGCGRVSPLSVWIDASTPAETAPRNGVWGKGPRKSLPTVTDSPGSDSRLLTTG